MGRNKTFDKIWNSLTFVGFQILMIKKLPIISLSFSVFILVTWTNSNINFGDNHKSFIKHTFQIFKYIEVKC